MGTLNKTIKPVVEALLKEKPKVPAIGGFAGVKPPSETMLKSINEIKTRIEEPELKPIKETDILPSPKGVDVFERQRLQEIKNLNTVTSPIQIGKNPYYFVEQNGGVQVGEGSILYDNKIFNKNIEFNFDHLDKVQVLGHTGIVARYTNDKIIFLYDPYKPKNIKAIQDTLRPTEQIQEELNSIVETMVNSSEGRSFTSYLNENPFILTPKPSSFKEFIINKYGLKSIDAISEQGYSDANFALEKLAEIMKLGTPEELQGMGLMAKLKLFPDIPQNKAAKIGGFYTPIDSSITSLGEERSLAHEYGHALDFYFGFGGIFEKPASEMGIASARTDMIITFDKIRTVLLNKNSDYYKLSFAKEPLHEGKYWTKPPEMFARAFEYYVWNKVGQQSIPKLTFDFSIFDFNPTLFLKEFPLPQGKEKEQLFSAFDELFNKLKVRTVTDPTTKKKVQELYMIAPLTLGGVAVASEAMAQPFDDSTDNSVSNILNKFFTFFSNSANRMLEFIQPHSPLWEKEIPDLLLDVEGGSKRKAYTLNYREHPNSGITVGLGVDLGQMNSNDLKNLGINNDLIQKLIPYTNLRGKKANDYLKNNPLYLTNSERDELDVAVIKYHEALLRKRFNESSFLDFDQIPQQARNVLLSVAYQYGNLSVRTPHFWKAMTTGNYSDAHNELLNFGDKYKTRRKTEAQVLKEVLLSW